MKRVHVAVGVIVDADQQILISKRADHLHQGGFWEFPGGKVDGGETVEQALDRELFEELGIRVAECQPFMEIHHDYPDKEVFLDVWLVTAFTGEPEGREGQPLKWAAVAALDDYEFPQANAAIVERLRSETL